MYKITLLRACRLILLSVLVLGSAITRPLFANEYAGRLLPGWSVGDVGYYTPLSVFVGPDLKSACTKLSSGDLEGANKDFASALASDNSDEGAYFGFVQSADTFDMNRLQHLKQVASATSSANDEFRMGVYSFCWLVKLNKEHSSDRDLMVTLWPLAENGLTASYEKSHSLLAGLSLMWVGYLDGSMLSRNLKLDNELLADLCDQKMLNKYRAAKKHNWIDDTPGVPNYSKDKLSILRRVILDLYVMYSAVGSKVHDGVTVPKPQASDQTNAMAYLMAWAMQIKNAEK